MKLIKSFIFNICIFVMIAITCIISLPLLFLPRKQFLSKLVYFLGWYFIFISKLLYNIKIEILYPNELSVKKMIEAKGINLFYDSVENRKECCGVRKVFPLKKKLNTLKGWITGVRSDQNENRSEFKKVELDENWENSLIKYNPLVDWSYEQVFEYIKKHKVPYNKLHDRGYPSIGCKPCTRAIKKGDDLRSGRWFWENNGNTECGLHIK